MGKAIRHHLRPMVFGSLVGLAFVAGLVMIVRDLRLDRAPQPTGTELQARADANADAADAPLTARGAYSATRRAPSAAPLPSKASRIRKQSRGSNSRWPRAPRGPRRAPRSRPW